MGTTVKRIKKYIDLKGINNRKFEESVGFSNGAFASQYKNDGSIGVDKVEKILQIYSDLNPIWLLTGKGHMLLDSAYDISDADKKLELSDSNSLYVKDDSYKEKYIRCLEEENKTLRKDLKQKQEIIEGFLSGSIHKIGE